MTANTALAYRRAVKTGRWIQIWHPVFNWK